MLALFSGPLRFLQKLLTLIALVAFLVSCGFADDPPRSILIDALQSQIVATQTSIAQSLGLDPFASVPVVSRVRVDHEESLKVEGERFIHLEGTFDWQLPNDSVRVDSTFELYLQRGSHGEGWLLARPVANNDDQSRQKWLLYPLGLPSA